MMAARVDVPPTSTARYFMVAVACPGVRSKLAILGLVVVAALSGCGGDDEGPNLAPQQSAAGEVADSAGAGGGTVGGTAVGCTEVDQPAARGDGGATAPTDTLDPEQTWTLTFTTSCGTFVVTL